MTCTRCHHALADHCKSNQAHADHKEERRMMPLASRRGTVICKTKHCLQPLCSCTDFVKGKS